MASIDIIGFNDELGSMSGYRKKNEPLGQVAKMLSELRKRAGLTQRMVAMKIGRSYQPVYMAESYPGGVSREIVHEIATACGATAEELDQLEVLRIIDAKSLPLPKDVTEEQVRKMLAVLEATKATHVTS